MTSLMMTSSLMMTFLGVNIHGSSPMFPLSTSWLALLPDSLLNRPLLCLIAYKQMTFLEVNIHGRSIFTQSTTSGLCFQGFLLNKPSFALLFI